MSVAALNVVTYFDLLKTLNEKQSQNGGGVVSIHTRHKLLEILDINHVVRAFGFYPILFFKPIPSHRKDPQYHPIKAFWIRHYLTQPQSASTQALYADAHDFLHQNTQDFINLAFLLEPVNTGLLASPRQTSSVMLDYALSHIGQARPLIKTGSTLEHPLEPMLLTDLSHVLVAEILNITIAKVKHLRAHCAPGMTVRRHNGSQMREIERHETNRFALFMGAKLFEHLKHFGLTASHAFAETLARMNGMPALKHNLSEEFHLATNLFYWLFSQGHFKGEAITQSLETELTFPDNFLAYFHARPATRLPAIRKAFTFDLPMWLDAEHRRLLSAINDALKTGSDLMPILHLHQKGAFA